MTAGPCFLLACTGTTYNIYSYSMREVMEPETRWTALRASAFLLLLTVCQLFLAFGFFNSCALLLELQATPGYQAGPADNSLFYASTLSARLQNGYITGGQPYIHMICSVVSALVLALYLKQDTEGTLLSIHPIEIFLQGIPDGAGRRTRLWRAAVAIPLQLLWCMRASTIPVMAALGSAYSFATSVSVQDMCAAPTDRPICQPCASYQSLTP